MPKCCDFHYTVITPLRVHNTHTHGIVNDNRWRKFILGIVKGYGCNTKMRQKCVSYEPLPGKELQKCNLCHKKSVVLHCILHCF